MVVFTPPGSTKPAGPVHESVPGGGETAIETAIKPSLSPAHDSLITVSTVIEDKERSLIVADVESRQPKSSVTKTV